MSRSIKQEMIIKTHSYMLSMIHKRRLEKESNIVNDSTHEIINVEVKTDSEIIFRIFIKIYPYLKDGYIDFINKLISSLDSVKNIDNISSVTKKDEISLYQVELSSHNIAKSSFHKLSNITLLEHIEDICDCLIKDYTERNINGKEKWFTHTEFQQLILLALVHDIGKITPLMDMYGIAFNNKNHEERSYIFFEMFLEGGNFNENITQQLKRLLENLKKISNDKKDTNTIKRFLEYDIKARVLELSRLQKEE